MPWGRGPARITVVRHGESVGNLADARARQARAERLDLDARDADVELSETGRRQAAALADWLGSPAGRQDRPDVVVSSPYRRAAETAALATSQTGVEVWHDERLRERDLGLFDGLTSHGIRAKYEAEAERRQRLGKFYYQPPSGESWCDVVLRVRSLLRDLQDVRAAHAGANVWLVTHQAVIMSIRYVLERLDEERLLDIDRTTPLPNASLTVFSREADGYALDRYGDAQAVEQITAEVTDETDAHEQAGESGDRHD